MKGSYDVDGMWKSKVDNIESSENNNEYNRIPHSRENICEKSGEYSLVDN